MHAGPRDLRDLRIAEAAQGLGGERQKDLVCMLLVHGETLDNDVVVVDEDRDDVRTIPALAI